MNTTPSEHIVIAGGSGFLGRLLSQHFLEQGRRVIVLTRGKPRSEDGLEYVHWDGETLTDWQGSLNGSAALINLAGRSVDCRYDTRNRRLIMDSRINSTRVLGEAITRCDQPPPVWLNSSTATIYRHTFNSPWDENGEIGATSAAKDEFSIYVARAWERAFFKTETPNVRKVALRSAMVLGTGRNSVFPVLQRLVRFGLGGAMAGGNQFVSWIHQRDFSRAIDHIVENNTIKGAINVAAPAPLVNRDMMRILREQCDAPLGIGLPAPEWLLEFGAWLLRTETELIVKSRNVAPHRLSATDFEFKFSRFIDAVRDLVSETS